jgi:hypothetical protein
MPKESTKSRFGVRAHKKVRSRNGKPSRRIVFEKDHWYSAATRSISITSTGRGANASHQWILFAQRVEADDHD